MNRLAYFLCFGVVAACSAEPVGSDPASPIRSEDLISRPSFTTWSCTKLECLDLETMSTSPHDYAACAAVADDAVDDGNVVCEQSAEGKSASSVVVSTPATCVPLGSPCIREGAAHQAADVDAGRRAPP